MKHGEVLLIGGDDGLLRARVIDVTDSHGQRTGERVVVVDAGSRFATSVAEAKRAFADEIWNGAYFQALMDAAPEPIPTPYQPTYTLRGPGRQQAQWKRETFGRRRR